ncbi:MAG: DUF4276 family protein [Myxococcota bacterium]
MFVHRDPDGPEAEACHAAIRAAVEGERLVVPVVPVQELEAWLLLDEDAIRRAVGRPRDRDALGLPPRHAVEGTASPKERLEQAIHNAQRRATRRRVQPFAVVRRRLLEQLELERLEGLPAFDRLRRDIHQAVSTLADRSERRS